MRVEFAKGELFDLFKAWGAISLAFGILSASSLMSAYGSFIGFVVAFCISLVTAGLGFILHELAHKFVAIKYYCSARFKANDSMLLLAILVSFAGFIFAAPGYVLINGNINKKQSGIISFAGPFSNFLLALVFLPGFLIFENVLLSFFFFQGFFINSWLGLFNLIPFRPFDGFNVYKWNKVVFFSLVVSLLVLVAFGLNLF